MSLLFAGDMTKCVHINGHLVINVMIKPMFIMASVEAPSSVGEIVFKTIIPTEKLKKKTENKTFAYLECHFRR